MVTRPKYIISGNKNKHTKYFETIDELKDNLDPSSYFLRGQYLSKGQSGGPQSVLYYEDSAEFWVLFADFVLWMVLKVSLILTASTIIDNGDLVCEWYW